MTALATIDRELARLHTRKAELEGAALLLARRSTILCKGCRKRSRVSSWTFEQQRHYIPPHGCTGGDYWMPSETRVCHIICGKCGFRDYIYNHKEREKIVQLADNERFGRRALFGAVVLYNKPYHRFG